MPQRNDPNEENIMNNIFSVFTIDQIDPFMTNLMEQYTIHANGNAYQLLETELYYHTEKTNTKHADTSVFERNTKAQQFFFHAYGIDICFQTSNDEKTYGGVLIRSIKNVKTGGTFCGPVNCHDEILRNMQFDGDETFLRLRLVKSHTPQKLDLMKTPRIKGEKDDFDGKPYRYISKELYNEIIKRKNSDYYRKRLSEYEKKWGFEK